VSVEAAKAVWDHSAAEGTPLVVMLALANRADEWGYVWWSVDTIAAKARLKRRAGQYNLRKLEGMGELEVVIEGQDRGGRHYTTLRRITLLSDNADARADAIRRFGKGAPDGRKGASGGRERAQAVVGKGAPHGRETAHTYAPDTSVETEGEKQQELGDDDTELEEEARRLLHERKKVGAKVVTDEEMECVRAAVEEFNAQGSFEYGLSAHLDYIVRRVRERPKWDSDTHRRLVQSAFRIRWWEQQQRGDRPRRPSPKVVYGNPGCFEQVVQDAVDERKGHLPPSRRAHQREGAEDDYRRAVEAAMRPDDSAV
jgi:hypothetical protein